MLLDSSSASRYLLPMNANLQFDPATHQLTGPAGSLSIPPTDQQAHRFLMLMEGECLQANISDVAQKYGYCRQRYYQLLKDFAHGGLPALLPRKTGPQSPYRRTDQAVRQVLRYLFLDSEASPEVITQKLRQTHFQISLRSVHRIIADYGLQKKTLRSEPQKPAAHRRHPARCQTRPQRACRRPQRRTRRPPTPGR